MEQAPEQILDIEKEVSPEKRELLELEAEEKYIFHGSGNDVEELEPRQAHTTEGGVRVPDGAPAVFGSPSAEYAIFMAIVSKKNCPGGFHSKTSWFEKKDGGIGIRYFATKDTLEQIQEGAEGTVYVLDRKDFTRRGEKSVEYANPSRAIPLRKIKVHKRDLPDHIEILEETL